MPKDQNTNTNVFISNQATLYTADSKFSMQNKTRDSQKQNLLIDTNLKSLNFYAEHKKLVSQVLYFRNIIKKNQDRPLPLYQL